MKARKPIMWSAILTILGAAKDLWSMFSKKAEPEPIPEPVNPKRAKDLLDPKE